MLFVGNHTTHGIVLYQKTVVTLNAETVVVNTLRTMAAALADPPSQEGKPQRKILTGKIMIVISKITMSLQTLINPPKFNQEAGKYRKDTDKVANPQEPIKSRQSRRTNQSESSPVTTIPYIYGGRSFAKVASATTAQETSFAADKSKKEILEAVLNSFVKNIKDCNTPEEKAIINGMLDIILKIFI